MGLFLHFSIRLYGIVLKHRDNQLNQFEQSCLPHQIKNRHIDTRFEVLMAVET